MTMRPRRKNRSCFEGRSSKCESIPRFKFTSDLLDFFDVRGVRVVDFVGPGSLKLGEV